MITRREANVALLSVIVAASMPGIAAADEPTVDLPSPQMVGGKPLMEALKARRSTREYDDRPLPPQVLSNLLWAAWGINRPQSGLRTAPSSHEYMDIDVYLAMANGVWFYDPKAHRILRQMQDDVRGETTTGQDFVKTAPLNLIYVSDAARMGNLSDANRLFNGVADSAVIAQNVYLYCASEGLATVVRGSVPGKQLAKRLHLRPTQAIYLAQTVGYPKGSTL
ncbi:MAG: SagB/ThcOx family dehydrogenase [Vulcanimicrobiaceae bacterium]